MNKVLIYLWAIKIAFQNNPVLFSLGLLLRLLGVSIGIYLSVYTGQVITNITNSLGQPDKLNFIVSSVIMWSLLSFLGYLVMMARVQSQQRPYPPFIGCKNAKAGDRVIRQKLYK